LQLKIFISTFFKKLFGVSIDYRFNFKAAADAEFDIFGIAEHKSLSSDVLVDCPVQQLRKLIYRQILRGEAGTMAVAYIPGQEFLASLCEFDYLNKQFSNIIRYQ